MTRTVKPDGLPGEFKCRTCDISWSSFMQNNLPCTDKTMRFGLHNFDFSRPILLEKPQTDLF
jgi:hypothetical protein